MAQHSPLPFGHSIGTKPTYYQGPNQHLEYNIEEPIAVDSMGVFSIIIPHWVRLALRRNKLSSKDLLKSEVIGNILSYSDYAKFLATQQILHSDIIETAIQSCKSHNDGVVQAVSEGYEYAMYSIFGNTYYLSYFHNGKHESPLIKTGSCLLYGRDTAKEIIHSARSLLEIEDSIYSPDIDTQKKYHKIELSTDGVFYIDVDPGILNALKDRDYVKTFISDYLKALYTYMPVHQACKQFSMLFKVYLYLL